ncbi:Transcriptional regulator, GntR family protein [Minicystis rosea]|nr:Transcriptional regulator, GntR family protein [Minicystis rosea]
MNSAASAPSVPTLATTLVDRLRTAIVKGQLAPGEKLRLEKLAARYGVGRSPLREAFCRLAAEGLVVIVDQRGFRVSTISREDLVDLTRTRQQIESLALRASIAKGGLDWEGEVMASLHRLSRLDGPRTGDRRALDDAWAAEHRAFHAALVSACGSPWLLRFREVLYDQSERYRSLALGAREGDVAEEHDALARAALARDADRACALFVEHVARTADAVLAGHGSEKADTAPASARKPRTSARARKSTGR